VRIVDNADPSSRLALLTRLREHPGPVPTVLDVGATPNRQGRVLPVVAVWERFYNYDRPHGAHGGKTPYEVLREKLS
jgi:hypothetical protein